MALQRDNLFKKRTDVSECWLKNVCQFNGLDRCNCNCPMFEQLDYLLQTSGLPRNRQHSVNMVVDDLDEYTYDMLVRINNDINNFVQCGYNLYLYGDVGVGKSTWAIKLMNNYFASICHMHDMETHGVFVNIPSFLRDSRDDIKYKDENFRNLCNIIKNCDIVVWDDIGQTEMTQYEAQMIYSYINDRCFSGKCNIYTSNLSPEEMEGIDKRLYSRVCENSDCLEITGIDRRSHETYSSYLFNSMNGEG